MDIGQIRNMSPIVLAYIGDSTYEQRVRLKLINLFPNEKINVLHKKAVAFAKASSQAKVVHFLREKEILTDEELYFVKRGRNTQSSVPKNADIADYRYATGFEAMIGYLVLGGHMQRVDEIVEFAFEIVKF